MLSHSLSVVKIPCQHFEMRVYNMEGQLDVPVLLVRQVLSDTVHKKC
jgi:hypothetical protein